MYIILGKYLYINWNQAKLQNIFDYGSESPQGSRFASIYLLQS